MRRDFQKSINSTWINTRVNKNRIALLSFWQYQCNSELRFCSEVIFLICWIESVDNLFDLLNRVCRPRFDSFADSCGPNWHRGGPYESTWEPYRASWVARHPENDRMIGFDFFKINCRSCCLCVFLFLHTFWLSIKQFSKKLSRSLYQELHISELPFWIISALKQHLHQNLNFSPRCSIKASACKITWAKGKDGCIGTSPAWENRRCFEQRLIFIFVVS